MKKLLVWVGLVVFSSILLVSIAKLAGAKGYDLYFSLPDGASQILTGKGLNKEITRIVDGKVTCYIVTTKINQIEANNSISCVK